MWHLRSLFPLPHGLQGNRILELLGDGRVECSVAIAVDRAPPGGHPVDQLAPVGQPQANALCRDDRQRRQSRGQGAVGVPDALPVEREQCRPVGQAVLVLVGDEVPLARSAHRAEPGVGDVLESGPRWDPAVRVALLGVIDVAAGLADPLLGRGGAHRATG